MGEFEKRRKRPWGFAKRYNYVSHKMSARKYSWELYHHWMEERKAGLFTWRTEAFCFGIYFVYMFSQIPLEVELISVECVLMNKGREFFRVEMRLCVSNEDKLRPTTFKLWGNTLQRYKNKVLILMHGFSFTAARRFQ